MHADARELGRIVVGFDGSERGRDALRLGELLANTAGAELELVLVRGGRSDGNDEAREVERLAAELGVTASGSDFERGFRVLTGESPARALNELAEAEHPALIVLGSTRRGGLGRVVPGSVTGRLLSGVSCPVVIAPPGYVQARLRVIAVGFDGSPEATTALRHAATLAGLAGATLRVIAVGRRIVGPPPEPAIASGPAGDAGADLQSRLHEAVAGLPPELRALPMFARGDPVGELLARADEGVDMLVLGSRGYGPLRAVLLGSVSAAALEHAPCPVLITPRSAAGAA
jgi:nucleotide-binding universal stress UspA family protein